MRFKTLILIAALALVASTAAWAASAAGTTVKVEKTKIGKLIATSKGLTLYFWRGDKGTKSACYGQCAKFWPPLITTGKPVAAAGVKASLLGTSKRTDGKLQVTFKGHPLYTFAQDKKPGQTLGEASKAFGADWYALTPTGVVIDTG
jgi:predicted lipoprotein with Yx(FWY)xxD motif